MDMVDIPSDDLTLLWKDAAIFMGKSTINGYQWPKTMENHVGKPWDNHS